MIMTKNKLEKRSRRQKRVRSKVRGTSQQPRLAVFRSNKHLWIQLIDDEIGKTLVSANDLEIGGKLKINGTVIKNVNRLKSAAEIGLFVAKKAAELKISRIVFDRGGYKYHGLVKQIAEGARKGGLKF